MCGFVTILTAPGQTVSGGVLKGMTKRLAHRGPDDLGYACVDPATGLCRAWRDDLSDREPLSGAVFGHRRLSILDLTPAGHQPMISDDGSLVLAYNGEVYNFVELRQQLASLGSTFRGRGDTEVLLRAYEHWGAAAVERLNGMWAFAVWDGRRRALVASRDRFGVKPLYYTVVDGAWVFASEIKALLAYPGAFRGHDERRVHAFLTRSTADHDAGTMFRGVRAVPPASTLEVAPGALPDAAPPRTFWSPRVDPERRRRPERALVEEMASLLADAVRLRLRSDVPVGTMLSGGLDSTSITLLIDEHRRRGDAGAGGDGDGASAFEPGGPPHQTFTASFPGWPSDEAADAELVCARLGLPWHRVCPSGQALADALPAVAYALDEPFRTPIAVVQYLLMREAAARGVKVVVNGHGSDEILGGYPRLFVGPLLAGLLARGRLGAFARERRAFAAAGAASAAVLPRLLLAWMMPAPLKRGLGRLLARGNAWRWRHLFALPRASGGGESDGDVFGHPPTAAAAAPRPSSPLNDAIWQTFAWRILPMWLRMEDRMSMAWSVESRLPFMDYRLVEFAFDLPDAMKLNDGYTKYVQRRAFWDRLPERIVRNRVKRCFRAPYEPWFRGAWRPMIEDLLLSGRCHLESYLSLPAARGLIRAYLDGRDDAMNPFVLWRILITELWLRAFADAGRSVGGDGGGGGIIAATAATDIGTPILSPARATTAAAAV